MVNDRMADILSGLAQHLAEIIEADPEGVYLYAESNGASCGAGIFKDAEQAVAYFDPDDELYSEIFRLWKAAEPGKKWAILQYEVKNGQFDASFGFPEELDPEETIHDRRQRALRERYGDKPVIYPPLDDRFRELTADDLPKD